ncbi:hypothetical protein [Paenibacillus graminis]|uniref:hypothetical protein n=1 Tax=Paenibacillus graminis TaxID=189425 RepID=UPI002DC03BCA|nr:hypothetical protein [Paenibacillus graminis]MEC0173036.1 hypothetical protein [Paenibacillus graminis]
MNINLQELERDVLDSFFELNIDDNENPELTRKIAEISARIVTIALARISNLQKESE